ncbi:MAG: phenylalanine--tRNA ligase subunit beta [Haloarculaceae archaeon]
MPTVDVDPDELRELTGHDEKSDHDLREDLFALGLEFEGTTDEGEFVLEFAPDRLDRLSVEGIARSLRYQYGDDRGVYVPNTNDAEWTIEVDGDVPAERPYVTGAVVRGLDLDEAVLESLIQLQEKLHATMGRNRVKGAIGVHDLVMLKGAGAAVEPGDPTETTDEDADGGGGRDADGTDAGRATSSEAREDPTDPAREEPANPTDDLAESAMAPRDEPATSGQKAVRYTGIEPDADSFVPLESDYEMTPGEVLTDHPTGETYADVVADYERLPAIYDDIGLFSFPPVINGSRTEVAASSRDLFIEMTGTDQWTIDHMLNIVCYALEARGGQVEKVQLEYADDAPGEYAGETLVRPDFSTKEKTVDHAAVESTLGIDLDGETVVDLVERAGMDVVDTGGDESTDDLAYEVEIPPYRVDVLHPVDVVDDIGRAYGFNDLDPRYPDVSTVGGRHERSRHERAVREALVGLGFQDLLNFHLVGTEENYDRLNVSPGEAVVGGGHAPTIQESYSEDYEIVRTWALPSLLLVLENNTHRAYPQDLAEVGFAAEIDHDEETNVAERRTVAAVLAHHQVSYEEAKARLQALCRSFDADLETPPTDHPSFISGRTAEVVIDGESVGVIGELHPEVIVEYDLELPVAAFEFRLDALR